MYLLKKFKKGINETVI